MTTGYICDRCGETFTGGKWLYGGYHDNSTTMQTWDLCPECMVSFSGWMERGQIADMSGKSADCVRDGDSVSDSRESVREHSLESESVREQSESVRERRYESQDVTGSAGRVTEAPEMSHDTREKLEADVRKHYAYSTTTLMYPPSANETTDMLSALPVDTVIGWLDRQAAITERETLHSHPMCAGSDACPALNRPISESADRETPDTAGIGASKDEIRDFDVWNVAAELQAKVDELTAERDQWRDAYGDSERLRLELVKDLEHARKWNDAWRDLVHRYEGLCDELLDERDAMRGDA